MSQLAIVEAFADLPETCRTAGQRHTQALCLALFTLAIVAENRRFLGIEDWLKAYHNELVVLAPQRALTVLQHDSTNFAEGGISDLFGLLVAVFWNTTVV